MVSFLKLSVITVEFVGKHLIYVTVIIINQN